MWVSMGCLQAPDGKKDEEKSAAWQVWSTVSFTHHSRYKRKGPKKIQSFFRADGQKPRIGLAQRARHCFQSKSDARLVKSVSDWTG